MATSEESTHAAGKLSSPSETARSVDQHINGNARAHDSGETNSENSGADSQHEHQQSQNIGRILSEAGSSTKNVQQQEKEKVAVKHDRSKEKEKGNKSVGSSQEKLDTESGSDGKEDEVSQQVDSNVKHERVAYHKIDDNHQEEPVPKEKFQDRKNEDQNHQAGILETPVSSSNILPNTANKSPSRGDEQPSRFRPFPQAVDDEDIELIEIQTTPVSAVLDIGAAVVVAPDLLEHNGGPQQGPSVEAQADLGPRLLFARRMRDEMVLESRPWYIPECCWRHPKTTLITGFLSAICSVSVAICILIAVFVIEKGNHENRVKSRLPLNHLGHGGLSTHL